MRLMPCIAEPQSQSYIDVAVDLESSVSKLLFVKGAARDLQLRNCGRLTTTKLLERRETYNYVTVGMNHETVPWVWCWEKQVLPEIWDRRGNRSQCQLNILITRRCRSRASLVVSARDNKNSFKRRRKVLTSEILTNIRIS